LKYYPTYKDSMIEWVDTIPSHWTLDKPWTLFSPTNRPPLSDDEIITCFRDGVVTLRKNRREEGFTNSEKEIGYQRILPGDLVVHEMDGFEGSIGISDSEGKSTPVYTVIPPTDTHNNRFWMYLLRVMSKTRYIECLSRSIRERTTEFRWKTWKNMYFPVPPLPEQNQIVSFLDSKTQKIDQLIEITEKKIELLREKRTSLINHCVTKGLNPNVEMKDSGVEWIGEIPSHWVMNKFNRVVFFQEGPGLRTFQFTDDGTKVICVTNITENGIDFSLFKKFISVEEYREKYSHFTVQKGDLLLSSSGNSWGKVSEYLDDEEVILNTSTIRLNTLNTTKLNKYLIKYLLNTDFVRTQLEILMTGSCQPNFGPTHLNRLVVPIPPINEQNKIIEFLDMKTHSIDQSIQYEVERIDLLKEYRQSLISEVVTGKIDVRGWSG